MSTTLRDFHNRLRIVMSIDRDELESAGIIARGDHNAWGTFHRDPFRWLIRCDDNSAEKLWIIIERRAAASPRQFVPAPPSPQGINKGGVPRIGGSV